MRNQPATNSHYLPARAHTREHTSSTDLFHLFWAAPRGPPPISPGKCHFSRLIQIQAWFYYSGLMPHLLGTSHNTDGAWLSQTFWLSLLPTNCWSSERHPIVYVSKLQHLHVFFFFFPFFRFFSHPVLEFVFLPHVCPCLYIPNAVTSIKLWHFSQITWVPASCLTAVRSKSMRVKDTICDLSPPNLYLHKIHSSE